MENKPSYSQRALPKPPLGLDPERVEAAENASPRCPIVFVLDCSASMRGPAITELQEAMQMFLGELAADPICQLSAEPAVITCGGIAKLAMPFTPLLNFKGAELLLLTAEGDTPLGAALCLAVDQVLDRRRNYRSRCIPALRPIVIALTDGAATDTTSLAAARLRGLSDRIELLLVGIGPHPDMAALASIAQPDRPPRRLDGLRLRDFLKLVTDSLRSLSTSGDVRAATRLFRELSS